MSRNTQTCWTCRIRHKGCDGPGRGGDCDVCVRLNIECLRGYGEPLPSIFRHHEITDPLSQWNRSRAGRSSDKKFSISSIYNKLVSRGSNNILDNTSWTPSSTPNTHGRPDQDPRGPFPTASATETEDSTGTQLEARDIPVQPHPSRRNITVAYSNVDSHLQGARKISSPTLSRDGQHCRAGFSAESEAYAGGSGLAFLPEYRPAGQFEAVGSPEPRFGTFFLPSMDISQQTFTAVVPSNAPSHGAQACWPYSPQPMGQPPQGPQVVPLHPIMNSDDLAGDSSAMILYPQSYGYNLSMSPEARMTDMAGSLW